MIKMIVLIAVSVFSYLMGASKVTSIADSKGYDIGYEKGLKAGFDNGTTKMIAKAVWNEKATFTEDGIFLWKD